MNTAAIGTILFSLSVILGLAHGLGFVFDRLKQPRLIGEILAGVLIGPFVLGQFWPAASAVVFGTAATGEKISTILGFLYWIGLMLLMFLSGTETKRLMAKENRRETAWLLTVGLLVPFCFVYVAGFYGMINLEPIIGSAQNSLAALLVLSAATAVTSIPVISRIFHDLGILSTRFASLILGVAILEDIVLWVVLAVATGLVSATATGGNLDSMLRHVVSTVAYTLLGLTVMPRVLRALGTLRVNLLIKASPIGYLYVVLFVYGAVAALFDVNLIFAAFLAGFGIVGGLDGSERNRFSDSLTSMAKVSSAVFIPIYFALVGHKLVFNGEFSLLMLAVFLLGSSLVSVVARGLAARFSGFKGLDIVNIAIASNARGGPGIVMASVAYEAGIIGSAFYTTMVLTAVLTSQMAGVWLRYVLGRGWPLLSTNPDERWSVATAAASPAPLTSPVIASATSSVTAPAPNVSP